MAVNSRRTFLSHFVIVLACAGASFFAYQRGIFQAVYAADASMMTSAIAALFVVTAVWLGRQAWLVDNRRGRDPSTGRWVSRSVASAEFGHLAERLSVSIGVVGTVIGLYLQAKASPGEVNFTALLTTGCGAVGYTLIAILTFNLEVGIIRAGR